MSLRNDGGESWDVYGVYHGDTLCIDVYELCMALYQI